MRDHQIFEERKLVSTMQELESVLISLPISLFVTVIEQPNSTFCYGISLLKKTLNAEFNHNNFVLLKCGSVCIAKLTSILSKAIRIKNQK